MKTDGETGAVFVQRFVFEPEREYPDGTVTHTGSPTRIIGVIVDPRCQE